MMIIEFTTKRDSLKKSMEYLNKVANSCPNLQICHSLGNIIMAEGCTEELYSYIEVVDEEFGIISTRIIPSKNNVKPNISHDTNKHKSSPAKDVSCKSNPPYYAISNEISQIVKPILNEISTYDKIDNIISAYIAKCGVTGPSDLIEKILLVSLEMEPEEITFQNIANTITKRFGKVSYSKIYQEITNFFYSFKQNNKETKVFQTHTRFPNIILIKLFAEYFHK